MPLPLLERRGHMTAQEAVAKARECLRTITPLEGDCGLTCSAACCRSVEGEETGMLLFPGEEELYAQRNGWKILPAQNGKVVVCPGRCVREERPLSCRFFPLLPVVRDGTVRAAMDQRARVVCPLFDDGVRGLSEAFRESVRKAGRILMEAEETAKTLEEMTRQQDELKALRKAFGA
jgi:hypothetical protein